MDVCIYGCVYIRVCVYTRARACVCVCQDPKSTAMVTAALSEASSSPRHTSNGHVTKRERVGLAEPTVTGGLQSSGLFGQCELNSLKRDRALCSHLTARDSLI